jgi:pimeloyl-ACP methyl ester carboxylesterase
MKHRFAIRGLLLAALLLPLPLLMGTVCSKSFTPIIFVHGGSGSGAQFESQAARFMTNGVPQSYIRALEYDSSAIGTIMPQVLASLDALIAQIQAETGKPQVILIGHSLGTQVSQNFLATPARAANVARYINIDGRPATAPPGGVPTLALWAGAVVRPPPLPEITGALNVTVPDQEHVEVATSEESFFEMFHFINGRAPIRTRILPKLNPMLSGRATNFPQNTGLAGATVEIWLVDPATGERVGTTPEASYAIDATGNFGPFEAELFQYYEFAVLRPAAVTISYYFEPFLRDDHLIRLNVANGLAPFIPTSVESTAITVVRQKEFWGDRGAQNDVLSIDGTDVINATSSPSGAVGAASVSMFVFDVGSDETSNVPGPIPAPFGPLAFLTAQDLFVPADPPARTVAIVTVPRGDASAQRTINVPNLRSTEARVVVQLNDFEQ